MRRIGNLALLLALLVAAPAFVGAIENVPDTQAFALAARLLEGKGVDLATHSLTRDNLAYVLIQAGRLDKLEKLLATTAVPSVEEVASLVRTKRWRAKAEREYGSPASNEAIAARLRLVDETFSRFSRIVHAEAAGAEYSLILTGSLLKGHFSGESDVDLIVDTKSGALAKWAMESEWCTNAQHPDGYDELIAIADGGDYTKVTNKVNLRLLGQTVRVDGRPYEPGFLTSLYRRLMESRGVALDETFQATYQPNNYLYRMKREMPVWMVDAIGRAKDIRKALANLFGREDDETPPVLDPVSPQDLLRQETFERAVGEPAR